MKMKKGMIEERAPQIKAKIEVSWSPLFSKCRFKKFRKDDRISSKWLSKIMRIVAL
jgi:hypothetical protein